LIIKLLRLHLWFFKLESFLSYLWLYTISKLLFTTLLFVIVKKILLKRFANGPCAGSAKNGTCYTATECAQRGGENMGSCAAGFGVCCSSENKIMIFKTGYNLSIRLKWWTKTT